MVRSLSLAALLLTACSPEASAPPPAQGTTSAVSTAPAAERAIPADSTPIAAVDDLIGVYRVAGIDGTPLEADFGIALSIDGQMMSYEPTCAGFIWYIEFEGGALRTERRPEFNNVDSNGAPMVCAVAVPPEMRQLAAALDAADQAERTPSNGILLSGDGHSVLLFSQ